MLSIFAVGVVTVSAVGLVGGPAVKCGECICLNDAGEQYDRTVKKCCPTKLGFLTDGWDGFCDALAIHMCEESCMDANNNLLLKSEPYQVFEKEEGSVCKTDEQCLDHHVCYQGQHFGTCAHIMNAVHHAVVSMDQIKHLEHTEGTDGLFHIEKELSPDEIDQILDHLAERLGIDRSEITLDKHEEAVVRRQWGIPYSGYKYSFGYTNPAYNQPYEYSNGHVTGEGSITSAGDATSTANALINAGVELLAFDWDKTANTVNTYQESFASINQLAGLMSHTFIEMANKWCELGKDVAVVTYNDAISYIGSTPMEGPQFIQQTLNQVLDYNCAQKVKIYARNDSRDPRAGKSWHLQSAQIAFGVSSNAVTMLLDDTEKNIAIANPNGYKTIAVFPKTGVTYQHFASAGYA